MTGEIAKIFNIPQAGGLLVLSVAKKSPAYYMGLRGGYLNIKVADKDIMAGGDIVLSVDGIKLENQANLETIVAHLGSLKKGTKYRIVILRDGKTKEVQWSKD